MEGHKEGQKHGRRERKEIKIFENATVKTNVLYANFRNKNLKKEIMYK